MYDILNRHLELFKNKYQYFLLYCLFFYFFFMPDLSFIYPIFKNSIILLIIDGMLICINFNSIKKIFTDRLFLIISGLSIYTLIITIINQVPISSNLTGIVTILKMILFMFMIYYVRKYLTGYKRKLDFIISIGNIQGLICIVMLFVPFFKEIANYIYISNFPDYLTSPQFGITENRIFGIAGDYTFSLSIFMAMIAGISICMFLNYKQYKYILSAFVCIISSVLNGRTGAFILFIIVILLLLLLYLKKEWINKKNILMLILLFCFLFAIIYFLRNTSFIDWLFDGVKEILYLIKGEKKGTFSILLDEFMFLPDNIINIVFGKGGRVFGSFGEIVSGRSSDIGYINDIFRGGIIYCGILYIAILYEFYTTYFALKTNKFSTKFSLSLIITMIIFVFISNFKGEALGGSSILFLSLYIIYIFKKGENL